MAEEEGAPALDLSDVVDALRPHLRDLVETIAIAGAATTNPEGKRVPGDVKAASIGLELVSKYLSGRGSDRASSILKEALRQHGVRLAAEGGSGPDISDSEGEGIPLV